MQNRIRVIVAVAAVAAGISASPAFADAGFHVEHRPINEGGDTRPCATDQESDVVFYNESRMTRIRKVLDTNGTKVRKTALDGSVAGVTGLPEGEIATVPWRYREIRSYAICAEAEAEGYSMFLIEYNLRTGRAVQMIMSA